MKYTPLPDKEFLHECFSYDKVTGDVTWRVRPRHHFSGNAAWKTFNTRNAGSRVGTRNSQGYENVRFTYKGAAKSYLLHRLIWCMENEDPCDYQIDHINHNRSDNSICNLRLATSAQNLGNMTVKRDGLQGAFYLKDRGKWRAQIKINYASVFLGIFDTEEEAHAAYMKAKKERNSQF